MTTTIIIAIICICAGFVLGYYFSKFKNMSSKDIVALVRTISLKTTNDIRQALITEQGKKKISQIYTEIIPKEEDRKVFTQEQFISLIELTLDTFDQIIKEENITKQESK